MNEPRPSPGIRPLSGQGISSGTPPQPVRPATLPKTSVIPTQPIKQNDPNTEPMELVEELSDAPAASKIRTFAAGGMQRQEKYTRKPNINGQGAVRVRSFHGRLSDEGLTFLDDKVNEWLEQHPDVEVKFVTQTIGQFEGKIREAALVLNLWY